MGAARAPRRWKLLPFRRSPLLPPPASKSNKHRKEEEEEERVTASASPRKKEEEEEVPAEFLCPVLGAPMADPVILPSGRTYERACVTACAELGLALGPGGGVVDREVTTGGGGADAAAEVAIPNDALRAAVRTWCARSGRAPPVAPSAEEAREAVVRAAPARSASNLSSWSAVSRASAASTSSSSSSARSSAEIPVVEEVEVLRVKDVVKEVEAEPESVVVPDAEEEAVAVKAVEAGDETAVEAAMASLRRATREGGPARRRALCAPRLLAALRRVLLSSRHTASARADAAAALANISSEPENRVAVVRAGAVPALVDALVASPENRVPVVRAGAVPALVDALVASPDASEAREHAAGALFALALHDGNRAAIGVLGAVPPLLAVLAAGGRDHGDHAESPSPRARRDAGTALYHLSLAAVNQSKLARAPGGARRLLAVACDAAEPAELRRLALMVACNVAACAEGRAALMDAGAVAAVSAVLSASGDDAAPDSDLQRWCVAALYAMSRGSARFRGIARAAGADRPLTLIAEQASPGVHKEMAQTVLRTVLGLSDSDDVSDREGNNNGSSSLASSSRPHRRRVASWAAPAAATPPSSHHWRSVCID